MEEHLIFFLVMNLIYREAKLLKLSQKNVECNRYRKTRLYQNPRNLFIIQIIKTRII